MLCEKCGKVFTLRTNLTRHLKLAHGPSAERDECPLCFKKYSRKDNLYRHIETHKQNAPALKRKATVVDGDVLEKKYPKTNLKQAVLKLDPLPTEDPVEYRGTDPLIAKHWHYIRTHYHRGNNMQDKYNFRLPHMNDTTINKNIALVYEAQRFRAKWNISFGFILRNILTNEEGYYYPSNNTNFLSKPKLVVSRNDLDALLDSLDDVDKLEWARQQRPNSKFIVERITNMTVIVDKMKPFTLVGYPTLLPHYIIYNKSLIVLDKNYYGKRYDDNLCFFRCLALHHGKIRKRPSEFEAHVAKLLKQWTSTENFEGLDLREMDDLEDCFGVNIAIYELEPVKPCESNLKQLMREVDSVVPNFMPPALQDIEDDSDAELMPVDDDEDEEEEEITKGFGSMFINDMAEESDDEFEPCAKKPRIVSPQAPSEASQIADLPPLPIPTLIRKSRGLYNNTLHLNLYENHFSYITNIERFSKCWRCGQCDKLWNHFSHFQRHIARCGGADTEVLYKGGGFGLRKSIHEELREEGLEVPTGFYEFRATFDFETLLQEVKQENNQPPKLAYTKRLIPASVSVASNIPDYENPVCFIGEPLDIIQSMHAYLTELSEVAFELMKERFGDVYNILHEKSAENHHYEKQLSQLLRQNKVSGALDDEVKAAKGKAYETRRWSRYLYRFECWMRQFVVLGFNSAKFDLNLIKEYYIPFLVRNNEKITNVIMKNNAFMSLATKHFIFLDITNYLSPGTSYDKFLRAFNVKQQKGAWPYEWFCDLSQLNETELPPKEAFHSTLKNKDISQADYERLKKVWKTNGFKTMRDLLEWYNNLDVAPFLDAVQKMYNQFKEWNIDMFKDAISLPGVAMNRMFQSLPKGGLFVLFGERWKDIHCLIKTNIVGGPSIVFHRYHEVGKTTIRGCKPVGKILGYDANSLYLWALSQEMPTGLFAAWRPEECGNPGEIVPTESQGETLQEERERFFAAISRNGKTRMKPTKSYTHCATELLYLEYQRRELVERFGAPELHIQHRFNGGQKRFFHGTVTYYVDGYIAANKYGNDKAIIIEFDGCFWHGCGCVPTDNRDWEYYKRKERTAQKHAYFNDLDCEFIQSKECDFNKLFDETQDLDQWEEWLSLNGSSGIVDKKNTTSHDIITAIMAGKVFGIAEVDIQIPYWNTTARDFWEELPPVFKNIDISINDIGPFMKSYAEKHKMLTKPRRYLISSYHADKILLSTPMIKFLTTKCGLRITRLHQFIEFQRLAAFEHLGEEVAAHRRLADKYDDEKEKGEMYKLIGNNYYGRLLLDKLRFERILFATGVDCQKHVNDPLFKKMCEIDDNVYQVHLENKKVLLDLPNIIPFFVYQYAKQRMLEFYLFLLRSLGKNNFQLIQMDTDSFYFAVADKDLPAMIDDKHAREVFVRNLDKFIATDEYTKRTPGLFKLEWEGDGMIALNSKTYFGWKHDGASKVSTKGLSKVTNNVTREMFMSVLETQNKEGGTNYGFRLKNNSMMQYQQQKDSLTFFYPKRKVNDDAVSTTPLLI